LYLKAFQWKAARWGVTHHESGDRKAIVADGRPRGELLEFGSKNKETIGAGA
jgi:hypothetical protein